MTPTRFRQALLRWFDRHQRTLPWRGEKDPYRILVSEIMLQQTRVAVVKTRYLEFLQRFPTITHLARAREQSVLAAWSGLGYYRRARALQGSAKQVHREGKFPKTSAELQQLPGIGRYTAAAVASIAFGEPVAVVDGNVRRVLERLSGREMSQEECWNRAGELLEPRRPGDFNQAMMELGAVICLPAQPLCATCPVTSFCASRGPTARKRQQPRRKATLSYLLAQRNGNILLQQRPASASLMPRMWELPTAPAANVANSNPLLTLRHSITTTDYRIQVFAARPPKLTGARWVPLRSAIRLPLTGLTRKILRELGR